ncbi:MAG: hypothetical protein ACI9CA_000435 [Natronomonas sp.]|jgi:hypothetical protein
MSVHATSGDASIDLSNTDQHVKRKAEAARNRGYLDGGAGTTLHCPCGYTGTPAAVIRYSDWDEADYGYDLSICPRCGDA